MLKKGVNDYPDTGKRIIKNVLGKTQAEVKEKLKSALDETKALDILRAEEYTVASWLRTWYELYAKPSIRPTTADYYNRSIESHVIPRIGDIKLNRLTSRDIQKLYKDLLENGRLREAQKGKNPYMFPSPVTGEMYHPDSVVNIHKKILKDAGLEHIRFHDLRHTFATLALQNGVDVKCIHRPETTP